MAHSYTPKFSTIWVRTPDGTGNNLSNPDWGSAFSNNQRITKNSYADGKGVMAPTDNLPTPRAVTDAVMAQPKDANGKDLSIPDPGGANEFFQFFGQFLAHDINQTVGGNPATPGETVPLQGGIFGTLTRNAFELDAKGVRQHLNQETSFLDLSTVYGRTQATIDLLRADVIDQHGNRTQSAKLLVGAEGLPPTVAEVAANAGITVAAAAGIIGIPSFGAPIDNLYAVGDERANQTPALLAPHMVFLKNHNWHVDQLAAKNPGWSQDQLFNAARALNEAEWQTVVYNEYLTRLVGKDAIDDYKGYKAKVDPSIINEFASVAFRLGHDQSSNQLETRDERGTLKQAFTLAEAFTRGAEAIRTSASLDDWIRGLGSQSTQVIDGKVVEGNRNALFNIPGQVIDLVAIDIMRGRDQGTGNYNDLREGLGFKAYKSFDAFGKDNGLDAKTLAALKQVYSNDIDRLDSLVGGLLEKNAKGSMLGETFTKITVMQFEVLRDGDRYFHLNQLRGEKALLKQIEATSLADILERTTGVEHVYHDAFAAHQRIGGTAASETLTGTKGHDLLIGFDGHDKLNAGDGDDDLYGDKDNDMLYGDRGKDLLNGGAGNDLLWGGSHADVFVFGRGSGYDKIMDFNRKEDLIDLSDFGLSSWKELKIKQHGETTIIDFGYGDVLEVIGVKPSKLDADNFSLI